MFNDSLFSSKTEEWETPQDFFDMLDLCFCFTLDVCATDENAKCLRYFTKKEDGLLQSWKGETVWCNPPYGRKIKDWVKKASTEDAVVVMLLPARTDTSWFHDYIYNNVNADVIFLRGRLRFGNSKTCAPFPNMVVVFGSRS